MKITKCYEEVVNKKKYHQISYHSYLFKRVCTFSKLEKKGMIKNGVNKLLNFFIHPQRGILRKRLMEDTGGKEKGNYKIQFYISSRYFKLDENDEEVIGEEQKFQTLTVTSTKQFSERVFSNFGELLSHRINQIHSNEGSGWQFYCLEAIQMKVIFDYKSEGYLLSKIVGGKNTHGDIFADDDEQQPCCSKSSPNKRRKLKVTSDDEDEGENMEIEVMEREVIEEDTMSKEFDKLKHVFIDVQQSQEEDEEELVFYEDFFNERINLVVEKHKERQEKDLVKRDELIKKRLIEDEEKVKEDLFVEQKIKQKDVLERLSQRMKLGKINLECFSQEDIQRSNHDEHGYCSYYAIILQIMNEIVINDEEKENTLRNAAKLNLKNVKINNFFTKAMDAVLKKRYSYKNVTYKKNPDYFLKTFLENEIRLNDENDIFYDPNQNRDKIEILRDVKKLVDYMILEKESFRFLSMKELIEKISELEIQFNVKFNVFVDKEVYQFTKIFNKSNSAKKSKTIKHFITRLNCIYSGFKNVLFEENMFTKNNNKMLMINLITDEIFTDEVNVNGCFDLSNMCYWITTTRELVENYFREGESINLTNKDKTFYKLNVCNKCLSGFINRKDLLKHEAVCYGFSSKKIQFHEDNWFNCDSYKEFSKFQTPPFTIYYDVETRHKKINNNDMETKGEKQRNYQLLLVGYCIGIYGERISIDENDSKTCFLYRDLTMDKEEMKNLKTIHMDIRAHIRSEDIAHKNFIIEKLKMVSAQDGNEEIESAFLCQLMYKEIQMLADACVNFTYAEVLPIRQNLNITKDARIKIGNEAADEMLKTMKLPKCCLCNIEVDVFHEENHSDFYSNLTKDRSKNWCSLSKMLNTKDYAKRGCFKNYICDRPNEEFTKQKLRYFFEENINVINQFNTDFNLYKDKRNSYDWKDCIREGKEELYYSNQKDHPFRQIPPEDHFETRIGAECFDLNKAESLTYKEQFVNGIYDYLLIEESVQKLLILLNEINFDIKSVVGISNMKVVVEKLCKINKKTFNYDLYLMFMGKALITVMNEGYWKDEAQINIHDDRFHRYYKLFNGGTLVFMIIFLKYVNFTLKFYEKFNKKAKISVHGKKYEIILNEKDDYLEMLATFKEKFPSLLKVKNLMEFSEMIDEVKYKSYSTNESIFENLIAEFKSLSKFNEIEETNTVGMKILKIIKKVFWVMRFQYNLLPLAGEISAEKLEILNLRKIQWFFYHGELTLLKETKRKLFTSKKGLKDDFSFQNFKFLLNDQMVIDHDHFSYQINGFAHSSCNLKSRVPKQDQYNVLCIAHNASFDNNFLLKGIPDDLLMRNTKDGEYRFIDKHYNLIGKNTAHIRYANIGNLQMRDSFQMFPESLDDLTKVMTDEELKLASKIIMIFLLTYDYRFRKADESLLEYEERMKKDVIPKLFKKGIFPYDKITQMEYLEKERTHLPPKSHFYNLMKDKHPSEEEYLNACEVYQKLPCYNMADYMMLYNMLDVAFLMSIYEKRCDLMKKKYKLDARNFTSMSEASYAFMKKDATTSLQNIPSQEIYDACSEMIRAGYAGVACRHGISTDGFPLETLKFRSMKKERGNQNYQYYRSVNLKFDENNQYGGGMSKENCIGGYFHYPPDTFADFAELYEHYIKINEEVEKVKHNESYNSKNYYNYGFLVQYSAKFTNDLKTQEFWLDFPNMYEKMKMDEFHLSPYQLLMMREKKGNREQFKKITFDEKLMTTFNNQSRRWDVIDYLKFITDNGWQITKIHDVIGFLSKCYMKNYILFNQKQRQLCKNEVEKRIFKLANNAMYGANCKKEVAYTDISMIVNCKRAKNVNALLKEKGITDKNVFVIDDKNQPKTRKERMALVEHSLKRKEEFIFGNCRVQEINKMILKCGRTLEKMKKDNKNEVDKIKKEVFEKYLKDKKADLEKLIQELEDEYLDLEQNINDEMCEGNQSDKSESESESEEDDPVINRLKTIEKMNKKKRKDEINNRDYRDFDLKIMDLMRENNVKVVDVNNDRFSSFRGLVEREKDKVLIKAMRLNGALILANAKISICSFYKKMKTILNDNFFNKFMEEYIKIDEPLEGNFYEADGELTVITSNSLATHFISNLRMEYEMDLYKMVLQNLKGDGEDIVYEYLFDKLAPLAKRKLTITFIKKIYCDYLDQEEREYIESIQSLNMKLIFTDTDSLSLNVEVKCKESGLTSTCLKKFLYFYLFIHYGYVFDTANFDKNNMFFCEDFKKNLLRYEEEHPYPEMIKQTVATAPKEYLEEFFNKEQYDKQVEKNKEKLSQDVEEERTFFSVDNVIEALNKHENDDEIKQFTLEEMEKSKQKHKGIKGDIIKKSEYLNQLMDFDFIMEYEELIKGFLKSDEMKVSQRNFKFDKEEIFNVDCMKQKLCKLNDKRYYLEDGVHTLPHGCKMLKELFLLNKGKSKDEIMSTDHIKQLVEKERELLPKYYPRLAESIKDYKKYINTLFVIERKKFIESLIKFRNFQQQEDDGQN